MDLSKLKRGRPARNSQINIRCSKAERRAISAAAGRLGITVTEYLIGLHRLAQEEAAPPVPPPPPDDYAAEAQESAPAEPVAPAKRRSASKKAKTPPKPKAATKAPAASKADTQVRTASFAIRCKPWDCACGEKAVRTTECPACGKARP